MKNYFFAALVCLSLFLPLVGQESSRPNRYNPVGALEDIVEGIKLAVKSPWTRATRESYYTEEEEGILKEIIALPFAERLEFLTGLATGVALTNAAIILLITKYFSESILAHGMLGTYAAVQVLQYCELVAYLIKYYTEEEPNS